MKKILPVIFFLLCLSLCGWARHIKGGEIYYTYLGPGLSDPSFIRYQVTLRMFVICDASPGQTEDNVFIGIFDSGSGSPAFGSPFEFFIDTKQIIQLTKPNPCIVNPSDVCYQVRYFTGIVELPKNAKGYDLVYERCCRIDGINNESPNTNVGAAYTCHISGTDEIGLNGVNSSAQFLVKDTVLICQNRPFALSFGAIDQDGDSLSYQFATPFEGGDGVNFPIVVDPVPPGQLFPVEFAPGYNGNNPLGSNVKLNNETGLISGLAPRAGDYVVCVLLKEWRDGVVIGQHRKDFIIHIDDRCDFASADLKPTYITCDGLNYTFQNEAPASPLIHAYYWDFGVTTANNDTSLLSKPQFTYPDSGTYTVKLYVNKGEDCSDSATTQMKVYPGFHPGFKSVGTCLYVPIQFIDTTYSRYGQVTGWNWNFGDELATDDSSRQQNTSWLYHSIGSKSVKLIVGNTKGCLDTVIQTIQVLDKPPITLPFNDTLICSIDTLQLHAQGLGVLAWTPAPTMLGANTPDPFVFPKKTTAYYVTLNENGCVNTDSVRVRVVDFVTLSAGNDSTICLTDTITLNPTGDGLKFAWSPTVSLDDPSAQYPHAFPATTTTYTLTASIGKCNATDQVTIKTVPYPVSFAGTDTSICFSDTAQLHGSIVGSTFTWSPVNTLRNSATLFPQAFPSSNTTYALFAYDNKGCPKPGISYVTVRVHPKINAFAGHDTSIVINQPLQLSGSGAEFYQWSPSTGLNDNSIQNPVAVLNSSIKYIMKTYDSIGCFALDTIAVRVFKTIPDIFVPNAFTPGKGSNGIFKPIPAGISSLEYFRIYNRFGQLVYSTSQIGAGWDGNLDGKPQSSSTFVWMVKGTDYTGKTVIKKGTMVLIR